MLKVAMIAGEASGDMLASTLIKALKQQYSGAIEFVGIGGRMMTGEGFKSWHAMETLSVMGYIEVIKSLPQLIKLRYQVLKELLEYQPDVFIGVDAPDFNFFIEHKLKTSGIKTVHYISPTIWAWRYERIFKIKKSTDLMLCIFPFEEAIYHKEGIAAKFIGHPMANEIEMDVDTNKYRHELALPIQQKADSILQKVDYSLNVDNKIIFTVLCGSRKREVNSIAKILIETCNLIHAQILNSVFIFPFTNESTMQLMQSFLQEAVVKPKQGLINQIDTLTSSKKSGVHFEYKIFMNKTREAIKSSDFVIAKSGTVSLETALCKKPMLIYYKINKFTEWLIKKKITIKYVGQPNIIMGREVVKEFLQDDANPITMSNYMINLYNNKSQQQQQIAEFYKLHELLLQDASSSGADAILELVKKC